jgi:predicted TPR repeat methyltransferase
MLKIDSGNYIGFMKHERKRLTVAGVADEARDALYELLIDRPTAWLEQARERMRDLPKTNFDLGCTFADQGKWIDAIFRFRIAAYFQPAYPQVWYNLGCCYFRSGRPSQARAALLKALQQTPRDPESIFMLAAIDPRAVPAGQLPQRMPTSMVVGFFSGVAETYDIEEARNGYQAGKAMYDVLKPMVKNPTPTVLDWGCGTGIAARPWRMAAKAIIGVDVTPAMVALAGKATHAERSLFDQVMAIDGAALPEAVATGSVDVVQIINVAQFVGDLSGIVASVARVLAPEGLCVMTVEPHGAQAGFGVNATTGRFGHAPAYVRQVAAAAGLAVVKEATVQLYPNVPVQAFIFSKGK